MPFSVKQSTFTAPTSSGAQSITGVGFRPKALLLWLTNQTATGFAVDEVLCFGFGTDSTHRGTIGVGSKNAQATSTVRDPCYVSAILRLITGDNIAVCKADLTSLDSDGFTLNWSVAPTSGLLVHFMALGGSDLTNATVGNFLQPGSSGAQSITGVGFKPDALLLLSNKAVADSDGAFGRVSIGMASGPTARAFVTSRDNPSVSPTQTFATERTDKITESPSDAIYADLTSFDTDGFTLNWSAAGTTNRVIIYLALKGGHYKVGSDTQRITTTGTKATTGVGFKPVGLFVLSAALTSGTTERSPASLLVGGTDGRSQGSIWGGSVNNISTTQTDQATSTSALVRMLAHGSTINAEASISSLDSDGFTLNWTTVADSTAREFVFLAFGSNTFTATVTETVTISDSVATTFGHLRSLTDTIAAVDSVSRTAATARSLGEAVTLSENIRRALNATRAISDAVTLGDRTNRAGSSSRAVTDTVALADANSATIRRASGPLIALPTRITLTSFNSSSTIPQLTTTAAIDPAAAAAVITGEFSVSSLAENPTQAAITGRETVAPVTPATSSITFFNG